MRTKFWIGIVVGLFWALAIVAQPAQAVDDPEFPLDRVVVRANSGTDTVFLVEVGDVDLLPANWRPSTLQWNKLVVSFPVDGGYFNVTGKLTSIVLFFGQSSPGLYWTWHANYFGHSSGNPALALAEIKGKVTFTTSVPAYGIVMSGFNDVQFLPTKTAPDGFTQIPICEAPATSTYQQCITLFKNAN